MNRFLAKTISMMLVLTVACSLCPQADAAEKPTVESLMKTFSVAWTEQAWPKKMTTRKARTYMRPADDDAWQLRMKTLQALVKLDKQAVEPLLKMTQEGAPHEQILAAQALSYLAPKLSHDQLTAALKSPTPAARLYIVAALGNKGNKDFPAALKKLLDTERNRDVRQHVGYVKERKTSGLLPATVERLLKWDTKKINTAQLGKPAPEIALTSIHDQKIKLSDYRGKQAVVLIFIYGDT